MEKELNDEVKSAKEGNSTVYEVSYLLLPTLSQEQVPEKVSAIKNAVTSVQGEVISSEDPVLIDLAYEMVKVVQTSRFKADKGYFGWIKFQLSSENIDSVKKFLDNNVDVLRYLLIKTVKENTLLNGKMKLKSEDKPKKLDEMSDDFVEEVKEEVVEDKVEEDLAVA
ncbi:MAG TPA: 30S ribosomal protein S6 [Parcubacteria group bacterium]|jgi:ribosomal protein S6|nr:30S ribosomal protein S6 [Parcubacteria group bacterium]